jgi:hypothetical protein
MHEYVLILETMPGNIVTTFPHTPLTFRFDQKVIHATPNRCCKKELTGIGIIEFNGLGAILGLLEKLGSAFKISRKFCIVTAERWTIDLGKQRERPRSIDILRQSVLRRSHKA